MISIAPHLLKQEAFYPFLVQVLGSSDIEVFSLAGDASNRRYYRVAVNEQSTVLMVWEPFEDNAQYPFLSVLNHFASCGVQVPRVIAKNPKLGFVLLEDLGDLTLERKFWENQNQQLCIPFYKQAIDELLKIHFDANDSTKGDCTAFHVAFDTEKLMWEMNYMKRHLLEGVFAGHLQGKFDQNDAKAVEEESLRICDELSRQPRVVTHRDYHSRNIMIKLGKIRVIDFQDARMGTMQYDLVSLLRDSYVNLNEAIAQELLDYYLQKRSEKGLAPLDGREFNRVYELQTVQRCLKACGSFASFYNTREDVRYLKYLPKTLQSVRLSLARIGEFKKLESYLELSGLYRIDFERELTGASK